MTSDLKEKFSRKRIAVGLQTVRRNSKYDVSRLDRFAVDDFRFVDDADNETRQIIFSRRIKVRHLGSLAAEQDASIFSACPRHSFYYRCGDIGLEFSRCKIIEKEQRSRSLNEN